MADVDAPAITSALKSALLILPAPLVKVLGGDHGNEVRHEGEDGDEDLHFHADVDVDGVQKLICSVVELVWLCRLEKKLYQLEVFVLRSHRSKEWKPISRV